MNVVICFCGGIASGKTTLATALAQRRGLGLATFGGFVRQAAAARGVPEERELLQALGESLIDEMTFDGFCRAVLSAGGWVNGTSIVVDGVRHMAAFEAIKRAVSPTPTKLCFVEVTREVRQERTRSPGREDHIDLARADRHSTEADVHGALRELADLVLDGTQSPDLLLDEVERQLAM